MSLRTENLQITLWQLSVPGAASAFLFLPLMHIFGVYKEIARFVGSSTISSIFKVFIGYSLIYTFILCIVTIDGVPRSIGLLQPLILLALALNARLFIRGLANSINVGSNRQSKNVLVYGAGEAGRQIANLLRQVSQVTLVGFLDDDVSLQNKRINGIKVSDPKAIGRLITDCNVQEILLATKDLNWERKALLTREAAANNVFVRIAPSLAKLLDENLTIDQLKKVEIEDLLGRNPVKPNPEFLRKNVTGKVVLVSGAGGSIGSELVLQLAKLEPKRLILLENSEFALYRVINAVDKVKDVKFGELEPVLGSVCDRERVMELVARCRPDTIFHAAAYKHVHIVEQNPFAGLETNYFGTKNLADAAVRNDVDVFLLISSDKAVRPTSFMGATKRLSELYIQHLANQEAGPKFVAVRFGNVLGSSGSVVPAFRAQIAAGGPVKVTHPDMERYFMTISEAVELVIQAGVIADKSTTLLLDMGKPIKIDMMARQMITLSGLTVRDHDNPEGQIEIIYTGLRPGEKLFEELLVDGRSAKTIHPLIFMADESLGALKQFKSYYQNLESLDATLDANQLKLMIKGLIPEYQPYLVID